MGGSSIAIMILMYCIIFLTAILTGFAMEALMLKEYVLPVKTWIQMEKSLNWVLSPLKPTHASLILMGMGYLMVLKLAASGCGLDPNNIDSDGDTLSDGNEDSDGDGWTNLREQAALTDPNNPDTDGDGLCDGDTSICEDDEGFIVTCGSTLAGNTVCEAGEEIYVNDFFCKAGDTCASIPNCVHGDTKQS